MASPQLLNTTSEPTTKKPQTLANASPPQIIAMESLKVPNGFDYASSQTIRVDIQVFNPNGKNYAQVLIGLYRHKDDKLPLSLGITDHQGRYQGLLRVPTDYQSLHLKASALGINNQMDLPIINGSVHTVLGQKG